jgi:Uma2 family endonuclease
VSTLQKTFLTEERYLEIERKAEFKSEYYQGEMFAMAGAKEAHNLIALNVAAEFRQQLRPRPCRAYMSDMRVRVNLSGLYSYPDVTVVCGEPQFLDEQRDTLLNPNLIVEVLSPSTEAYDRGRRFKQYRSVESVSEYLLVSSEQIGAELFTRQPDGSWLLTAVSRLEDWLDLRSVGCRLAMADVYEKVELTESADDALEEPDLSAAQIYKPRDK